jgi:uncharacterized Fe-S cluster-containing protein
MSIQQQSITRDDLPGLDCGVCGFRKCDEFAERLASEPDLLRRCIHLSPDRVQTESAGGSDTVRPAATCVSCVSCERDPLLQSKPLSWRDTLGREFDFFLEHFPEDPGPREIIIPHNPMLTREMDIQRGDILIGRPLGMSCGCPITHCGIAADVDPRTGVLTWCVTGPLNPREKGFKDLGYYIAEGYEGLVTDARVDLQIGMRYYFQPRMCMLQWRHSGLVNYLNRTSSGMQVRLEGLWIG